MALISKIAQFEKKFQNFHRTSDQNNFHINEWGYKMPRRALKLHVLI